MDASRPLTPSQQIHKTVTNPAMPKQIQHTEPDELYSSKTNTLTRNQRAISSEATASLKTQHAMPNSERHEVAIILHTDTYINKDPGMASDMEVVSASSNREKNSNPKFSKRQKHVIETIWIDVKTIVQ